MLLRLLSIGVFAISTVAVSASTLHVDADAMGGANDGSSWADAFTDLQTALQTAIPNDEILVAEGIYYPSALLNTGDSLFDDALDSRTATFTLKTGVSVYGGYAGFGADNPDLRDIRAFETILSGDLGAPGDGSDNSYHVVFAHYADSSALLDGFTITGGMADGDYPHTSGAGVHCNYGGPTVINCTFEDNYAYQSAAGLFNRRSGSTAINCLFVDNSVTIGGGAVENWQCFSTMTNCTFVGNMADSYAGAIYNNYCFSNITNCVIWDNIAPADPDMRDSASGSPVVTYTCVGGGHVGTGNTDADPLFLDGIRPGGDSPCLDAGTNGALDAGITTDLDGKARIADGDADGTSIIDMGAFELWHDCNSNGVVDWVDISGGTSTDCDKNAIPDICEMDGNDANSNGIFDACEFADITIGPLDAGVSLTVNGTAAIEGNVFTFDIGDTVAFISSFEGEDYEDVIEAHYDIEVAVHAVHYVAHPNPGMTINLDEHLGYTPYDIFIITSNDDSSTFRFGMDQYVMDDAVKIIGLHAMVPLAQIGALGFSEHSGTPRHIAEVFYGTVENDGYLSIQTTCNVEMGSAFNKIVGGKEVIFETYCDSSQDIMIQELYADWVETDDTEITWWRMELVDQFYSDYFNGYSLNDELPELDSLNDDGMLWFKARNPAKWAMWPLIKIDGPGVSWYFDNEAYEDYNFWEMHLAGDFRWQNDDDYEEYAHFIGPVMEMGSFGWIYDSYDSQPLYLNFFGDDDREYFDSDRFDGDFGSAGQDFWNPLLTAAEPDGYGYTGGSIVSPIFVLRLRDGEFYTADVHEDYETELSLADNQDLLILSDMSHLSFYFYYDIEFYEGKNSHWVVEDGLKYSEQTPTDDVFNITIHSFNAAPSGVVDVVASNDYRSGDDAHSAMYVAYRKKADYGRQLTKVEMEYGGGQWSASIDLGPEEAEYYFFTVATENDRPYGKVVEHDVAIGPDRDGDGIADIADNCPDHSNADQADCNDDGKGDVCTLADGEDFDCNSNGLPDKCDVLRAVQIAYEFDDDAQYDSDNYLYCDDCFLGRESLGFSAPIGGQIFTHFVQSSNGYVELLRSSNESAYVPEFGPLGALIDTPEPHHTFLLAGYDDLSSSCGYEFGYRKEADKVTFFWDTETLADECSDHFSRFQVVLHDDGRVQWNFDYADYSSFRYDLLSGVYLGYGQDELVEVYRHMLPEQESWTWWTMDCDGNDVPDECEMEGNDCNSNGIYDGCELSQNDCNTNGVVDDCELEGNDSDGNGVLDECDLLDRDCNANGILDVHDIAGGTSLDCQPDGIPDECQLEDRVGGDSRIQVFVFTDEYPDEIRWSLVDRSNGQTVLSGGPYSNGLSLYSHELIVPANGCYDFHINDDYGDGICCSWGDGYYEIYVDGQLVASGGDYGYGESVPGIGGCGSSGVVIEGDCNSNGIPDDCDAGKNTTSVADTLAHLNANNASISALVPDRFDFYDGDTGYYISDGGEDMYDVGNILGTDLSEEIPYTNGVILAGDDYFGDGSSYFTVKYQGLFAAGATDVSISEFTISGNLGADGSGSVDGTTLYTFGNGRTYSVYVKRVYDAGDPSINHMIMIPGPGGGVSQSWSSDTDSDQHRLGGLNRTTEVYYLLVASQYGGYIGDSDILQIAEEFLNNVAGEFVDCNANGRPNECDIAGGGSEDCNSNGVPDECEPGGLRDLNSNGMADLCDIYEGTSQDCNENGKPDEYEAGGLQDCNSNGQPDLCDIYGGYSSDCNENGVADECEQEYSEDCNANGVLDLCDIFGSTSEDCNLTKTPDECEILAVGRLYVDDSATNGLNDGTSWDNAHLRLSDALKQAACNESITHIWVAKGTYHPDPTGLVDPREATFTLSSGLAIYGGFSGDETMLAERDVDSNGTIMSGYLPDDVGRCRHVVTADGVDSTAVLDGLVIAGGYATSENWFVYARDGGGMLIRNAAPSVKNCRFSDNFAMYDGGAIFNDGGSPTIINCLFVGNRAYNGSANAIYTVEGSSVITNCTFSGNSSENDNGGVVLYSVASSPTITNCIVWGNESNSRGPIYVDPLEYDGYDRKVNDTDKSKDRTREFARHPSWTEEELVAKRLVKPVITYTCVEGGYVGEGNIDADPLFADNPDDGGDGWCDNPNYSGDEGANDYYGDLRLAAASPCMNAGSNYAVGLPALAFEGNSRIGYCRVDMGAYEATIDPAQMMDCNSNGSPDECDVVEGTSSDCNENSIPDECELGGEEDCNLNGVPDLCDISGGTSEDCNLNGMPDDCESLPSGVLYVNDSATNGLNDGSSWDDAYVSLHDALAYAGCSGKIKEVWVAAGIYTPDGEGLPDSREASFGLPGNVAIYGGFAGWEKVLSERDVESNETILSGDLEGDDSSEPYKQEADSDDNCYHVVTVEDVSNARLDGFIITHGSADGDLWGVTACGGALINYGGDLTIANCVFRYNYASAGGGAIADHAESTITIVDSRFEENWAEDGGAIMAEYCDLTLTGTVFEWNHAGYGGGALETYLCDVAIKDCRFVGNDALYCYSSGPNMNCRGYGGAIVWWDGTLSATNSTFIYNSSGVGGAIAAGGGESVLTNCTVAYNYAYEVGGGLYREYGWDEEEYDKLEHYLAASNCIFWGNVAEEEGSQIFDYEYDEEEWDKNGDEAVITYSCIEGGWDGEGNIDQDPLFENPFAAPIPYDAKAKTDLSPYPWDLHLRKSSPCIDIGNNDAVPAGIFTDLDGNERIVDGRRDGQVVVDMGAFEYFQDCNGDGVVDDPSEWPVGRVYVDWANTSGISDGTSWETAYVELYDALQMAECAGTINEVWVAGGAYSPELASFDYPQPKTFRIVNDIAIYGGFAGGETSLDQRDPWTNETLLVGFPFFGGQELVRSASDEQAERGPIPFTAYHVVTVEGTCNNGLLDGFVVMGGMAMESPLADLNNYGGGVLNNGGNIALKNCVFFKNAAVFGGGAIYSRGGRVVLEDVVIAGVMAEFDGGAILADKAEVSARRCRFVDVSASYGGGGAYCGIDSQAEFVNCLFAGALVGEGYGKEETGSSVSQWFADYGGTLRLQEFEKAEEIEPAGPPFGGAILNLGESTTSLVNCTITECHAVDGDGVAGYNPYDPGALNAFYISNSILYDTLGAKGGPAPGGEIYTEGFVEVAVEYSNIWGGYPGEGNIGYLYEHAPMFACGFDKSRSLSLEAKGGPQGYLRDLDYCYGLLPYSACIDAGDNESVPVGVLTDTAGDDRFVDGDVDGFAVVDMGAYEYQADCNANGVHDGTDIAEGTSEDCNGNSVPDECDIQSSWFSDCDSNGVLDECELKGNDCNDNGYHDACDIAYSTSEDCNDNGVPDECDLDDGTSADCNSNGIPDECDIAHNTSIDCDSDGVPDECEIAGHDCNNNGVYDACDILYYTSYDCNESGIPDECELAAGTSQDCNNNSVLDECDIASGSSEDCNNNGVPDWCDLTFNSGIFDCDANFAVDSCELAEGSAEDCNTNGTIDYCDILYSSTVYDCNLNWQVDSCEIAAGSGEDCNGNDRLDECDLHYGSSYDCDNNNEIDSCEIAAGSAEDCNTNGWIDWCDILYYSHVMDLNNNGLVDECEIAEGSAEDCNDNGVPDEVELTSGSTGTDCNCTGRLDECEVAEDPSIDCNSNGRPDYCDMYYGTCGSPGPKYNDCNDNDILDECETEADCNDNGVPDECEMFPASTGDCNNNGIQDYVEIYTDSAEDCNFNYWIDECEASLCNMDCNYNGIPDDCDLNWPTASGNVIPDCNNNDIPDQCELVAGTAADCNNNRVLDSCDIAANSSIDCNTNGVIDNCEIASSSTGNDCDCSGWLDECELKWGWHDDCNYNGRPDYCEMFPGTCDGDNTRHNDCNDNSTLDECDIRDDDYITDCNSNAIPDECDIRDEQTKWDCEPDGEMDACQYPDWYGTDCDNDGVLDWCVINYGSSEDCNENLVPDECDVVTAGDYDADGDVDLADFESMVEYCLDGPFTMKSIHPGEFCFCWQAFDFDDDADVDLADFAEFQRIFGGSK